MINSTDQEALAQFTVNFNVPPELLYELTPREITLGESLLTPGLQTAVKFHSYLHYPNKNLELFKNSIMDIDIFRPVLAAFGFQDRLRVKQRTYRLDNRKLINNNTEEFVLHACDDTLLADAKTLVSKFWRCTTPSAIVSEMLACVGARATDVEGSRPPRDYTAKNIHPFQVINEQAIVALDPINWPSFVHYMTYENLGTHKFRSLYSLARGAIVGTFEYQETGVVTGYANCNAIQTYNFPCDWDMVSDALNGVGLNGVNFNMSSIGNLLSYLFGGFGGGATLIPCGYGANHTISTTNAGTEGLMDSCPLNVSDFLPKRQARMNLLEQDKIALRFTVPWNPTLNAGKVVEIKLYNKEMPGELLYGSGIYLITSLMHTIKAGGYALTSMDCVSQTAGMGMV